MKSSHSPPSFINYIRNPLVTVLWRKKLSNQAQFWLDWNRTSSGGSLYCRTKPSKASIESKCHSKKFWEKKRLVTQGELTKPPLASPEEDSLGGNPTAGISCLLSEGEISIVSWSAWCLRLAGLLVFDRAVALVTVLWHEKVSKQAQFWPDWNRTSSGGSL
jgi:hypothetical protein